MTDTTQQEIEYVFSYDLWQKLQQRPMQAGDCSTNQVHVGYFRFQTPTHQDGGDAVCFWEVSPGVMAAGINTAEPEKAIQDHYNVFGSKGDKRTSLSEFFQWCSKHPVSEDEYWHRIEKGHWPGVHPDVARRSAEKAAAGIGHNNPPSSIFDELSAEIDTFVLSAQKLIKEGAAKTELVHKEAGNLAETLRELRSKAEKARKEEKDPHWEKCKEIDRKWGPIVDKAEIYQDINRVVVTPFQAALRRKLDEELRKQREESARLQREAEDAQRKVNEEAERIANEQARAAQAGMRPDEDKEAKEALEASAREAERLSEQAAEVDRQADQLAKTTIRAGGTRGKAITLRKFLELEVVDRRLASGFLKDQPYFLNDLDELLKKYARPLIQAGEQVPGIKSTTVERAA